jgi:hypothetical protein
MDRFAMSSPTATPYKPLIQTPAQAAAAAAALDILEKDPTNEQQFRIVLENSPFSSIFLGPEWYEKPHQLLNIRLCKELKKPMIIVCWKDSPLRNDILDGLPCVGVIQLQPEEKSRDSHVQMLIRQTWEQFGAREPRVWGSNRTWVDAA